MRVETSGDFELRPGGPRGQDGGADGFGSGAIITRVGNVAYDATRDPDDDARANLTHGIHLKTIEKEFETNKIL